PVDATLLEPLDLLGREAGASSGLVHSQLALQPRRGKRGRLLLIQLRRDRHRTRSSFCAALARPACEVCGSIDVAGGAEVVAGDESRVERSGALVWNVHPDPTVKDDRMPAVAAVAGRNHVAVSFAPRRDDPVDR